MSSCTPMWMWVYSRGPFTYPSWWIQLVCGWSTFGCLAVFPRHKGRKTVSLFLLFDYLRALIFKPLRSMEYDCSWAMQLAETFLSRCFRFSRWGFMLTCRTTADQACFCTAQFFLLVNNQIQKFELEAKCNFEQFFTPWGSFGHTGNSWFSFFVFLSALLY
jgi:hypothetical protein